MQTKSSRLATSLLAALLVPSDAAADTRPTLTAVVQHDSAAHHAALERLKEASRVVREAAREAEAAKRRLQKAREAAHSARDELENQCELIQVAARSSTADALLAEHKRELRTGRAIVLSCLFFFTFFNGVARRSLSSATPSLLAEGLLTVEQAKEVVRVGLYANPLGKFINLVLTIGVGLRPRRSILLQMTMMMSSCVAYLAMPASPAVQLYGWVALRAFSAMATSTMLPFVGAWFPRAFYGRLFAVLFAGFQLGALTSSYVWQHLLLEGKLHWRVPFTQCAVGFGLLLAVCARWLRERPPPLPAGAGAASEGVSIGAPSTPSAPSGTLRPSTGAELGALLHKVTTRWVFWAMLLAVASYTPSVEYSSHVTSYLKEMSSSVDLGRSSGVVCLQSTVCEGRFRGYVSSYVVALLVGSVLYDRATQLDRAFLVVGLLLVNVASWLALTLAEPYEPAGASARQVASEAGSPAVSWLERNLGGAASLPWRHASENVPVAVKLAVKPFLMLSGPTKTALASLAGATIALPSSLPFALFSLDFGKEGAATLSALLSIGGSVASLTFTRLFTRLRRERRLGGWFEAHAALAALSSVASLLMATIMFSDSRKFANGYIIRSSLLNETVVTLHACTHRSCAMTPMWRPGQRRPWGPLAGAHLKPHAPTSLCHHCGRGDGLVECSVYEAAANAAVATPFDACGEWIRAEKPLRKPRGGWAFANDPVRFPLA
jgi:hypothetical protein